MKVKMKIIILSLLLIVIGLFEIVAYPTNRLSDIMGGFFIGIGLFSLFIIRISKQGSKK